MAIELKGISTALSGGDEDIREAAAGKLGIKIYEIKNLRVKRQSVDGRRKGIRLVYTLHITLNDTEKQRMLEQKFGAAEEYKEPKITYGVKEHARPVIAGAGPCGLFAALTLARHGYKPLLLERGRGIAQREEDVGRLMSSGELDEESNVCFGAGGAGAFSDGKLATRIKDLRAEYVLETLVECGVPEELLQSARPHAGTEYIRASVEGMLKKIEELGGEIEFGSRLSEIFVSKGELGGITYTKDGLNNKIESRALILAVGHSARDTYSMLMQKGVVLEPKPFAIGLRIEHSREFIDRAQFGDAFSHPRLGAGEYRLTGRSGGRGVYTFCMCPGGEVICSSTERGGLAVNGMSHYARDGENSNSAVVVSVSPADYMPGVLGGVEFQRAFERTAFLSGYGAPVQTLGDFIQGRISRGFGGIMPSYRPHTVFKDLNGCLPGFLANGIKEGLTQFGKKLSGFDMPEAVLTGVETRTSSPVRILRDKDMQSISIEGLFPAGEGAGYAGGIVSAAVDGIKAAEALMRIYRKP